MSSPVVQNRILAAMAPDAFECLRPRLEPVALARRAILQEHNRPIRHIYFIERGVGSVFARTQRDGPVEVAMVGRLGFVGVAAVLGIMRAPIRCVMATPGAALRIATEDLRRVMDNVPAVRQHLLTYIHALHIQNTQTALCNVRHGLEERLCRWLLSAVDRLDETTLPLTHDQLAVILGVRRAGVTTALAKLQDLGAVAKTRGAVDVVDRAVLETKACECYRVIAFEYRRITHGRSHRHRLDASAPMIDSAARNGGSTGRPVIDPPAPELAAQPASDESRTTRG